MHPLETDASTIPVQWFMDSPMVRKSDEKSSMIKTPSRIDANLPPHIRNIGIRGNCFNGAFSNVENRYPLDVDYSRRNSVPSSPEQRNSPEGENAEHEGADGSEGEREVPTSPPSVESCRTQQASLSRGANLNGYINGFILQTRPKDKRQLQEAKSPTVKSTCSRVKMENNNSNNNRLRCEDAIKNGEKLPKADRANNCRNGADLRYVKDYLEYRHPDVADGKDQDKMLNGSDILRRMYESFGSRPGEGNGLFGSSYHLSQDSKPGKDCPDHRRKSHDTVEGRMKSPVKTQNRAMLHVINDNDVHGHGEESPFKHYPRHRSKSNEHTADDARTNDFQHSQKSQKMSARLAHEQRSRTPENAPSVECDINRRTSPSHSIESLLSKHVGDCHENSVQRYDLKQEKESERRLSPPKRGRKRSGERIPSRSDSTPRDSNVCPKRGRVSEREIYNEKSREIFRQDKELIENSLRQNPHLSFTRFPQDPALHSPPWHNASAMAALQANLMSAFPQNGPAALRDPSSILLKSASLAAAVSANPLLLGSNPYFVNPYILRGLGSSEVAAAAAYHQAVAQGLLQSHPSVNPLLNPGVIGNPGVPPGLNPFVCGLGDTSSLAAALAASVRPHTAALYPNFPYASVPQQHRHQVDDISASHQFGRGIASPSPSRSPLRPKRLSSEVSDGGQTTEKQHHEVNEVRKEPHARPSDGAQKRSSNTKISGNQTKPYVHSPPTSGQKRRSSSPSPIGLLPPKRKLGATGIDYSKKSGLKEFSPNSLLKPTKNKNGDDSKALSISSEKSQRNSEKLSSSRPSSYKNLTRERRLVANARERTRVHTISSAFEELRQQIPSYSCNQKLSKLAILRIACSYIQSLSVLAGRSTEGTFKESVDQCTRVLQAESRARSRRKNNKAQIEWEVANYEKTPGCDGEVKKKTDFSRSSPETTPSTYHNHTTVSSSRHDENAQVRGENGHRKAANDSPGFHRDSLGDRFHNKADVDHYSESGDQLHQITTGENVMTESDSLDSGAERIRTSTARSSLEHRETSSLGDIACQSSTQFSHNSSGMEKEKNVGSAERFSIDQSSDDDVEDQQNDLINVED